MNMLANHFYQKKDFDQSQLFSILNSLVGVCMGQFWAKTKLQTKNSVWKFLKTIGFRFYHTGLKFLGWEFFLAK